MLKSLSKCLIAAAVACLPGAAWAQGAPQASQVVTNGETQASEAWTLRRCIDYALDNNLQLKQSQIAIRQSEVEVEARKAALFPSLSFATNQNGSWRPFSEQYFNLTDGSMATTTSTVNYNGSYGLQAGWTVWNGGRNRKQADRSKLSLRQAEADDEAARLSIEEQIVQLYVQILYQTEAVEVNKEILASTRVQLARAQGMYDVGSMSRADLAQVEAQVAQEEYSVVNAQSQLEQFKIQLRQLLEIPGSTPFSVAVPAIGDDAVGAALPSVADVYDAAATYRPELRSSRIGLDAADLDVDIARRGYWPMVSMSAGINTSASSGLEQNWAKQMKTNLSNSIGLTLSVPIFDNKQNKTNVATARLNREKAQISLAQQQRDLLNSIETFYLNASTAQQQYAAAAASAESMRLSYELVSEQFAVGLKDIVDLTTAKSNLIQAEQQLLQSKYTALLNAAMLNFYRDGSLAPF